MKLNFDWKIIAELLAVLLVGAGFAFFNPGKPLPNLGDAIAWIFGSQGLAAIALAYLAAKFNVPPAMANIVSAIVLAAVAAGAAAGIQFINPILVNMPIGQIISTLIQALLGLSAFAIAHYQFAMRFAQQAKLSKV